MLRKEEGYISYFETFPRYLPANIKPKSNLFNDLIQKAIGWWLRVLGKHNPERVSLFLDVHWQQLKGVARKEATRKLSPEWQERILGLSKSRAE